MKKYFCIVFSISVIVFFGTSENSFAQSTVQGEIILGIPSDTPSNAKSAELLKQFYSALDIPRTTRVSTDDILKGRSSTIDIGRTFSKPLRDLNVIHDQSLITPGVPLRVVGVALSADLENSIITWKRNDTEVLSGIGKVSYIFTPNSQGTSEKITLTAETPDGYTESVVKFYYPGRVDLVWSTNTYTPAWYKGKALATPGSTLSVTAIPTISIGGRLLRTQDLTYVWSIDGKKILKHSGKGKNIYPVELSTVRDIEYTIGVEIQNDNKQVIQTNEIKLRVVDPQLNFYRRNSLYGLLYQVLADNIPIVSGSDTTFQFEPFFIQISDFENLEYEWSFDRSIVPQSDKRNRAFKLITEGEGSGNHTLSISYKNPKNIYSFGSKRLPINLFGR